MIAFSIILIGAFCVFTFVHANEESENRHIMVPADGTGESTGLFHIRGKRQLCRDNSDCPKPLTCHDVILGKVCMTPDDKTDKIIDIARKIFGHGK